MHMLRMLNIADAGCFTVGHLSNFVAASQRLVEVADDGLTLALREALKQPDEHLVQ